jgi:peptide methionine sulfoxide reductase msrA/msrB
MYKVLLILLVFTGSIFACSNTTHEDQTQSAAYANGPVQLATLAGGCFWCIEAPFEGINGIISVVSGYSGGKEKNPTYGQVSAGKTGHKEVVQIKFNPEVISYSEILDIYWQQFDPTDAGGSFYDRGTQYQSAIYYHNTTQKEVAEASKKKLEGSKIFSKPIVTPILKFEQFYPAEDYHQDYYKKSPADYYSYRKGSGRDAFIQKYWPDGAEKLYKKPSDDQLKKTLTKLQYEVTMKEATEPSFRNTYNGNKEQGIYVCIVSGAPLFSSKDKYESGSGWPSFTKPIDARFLEKPIDRSAGMTRVEVRSKYGKSHVGHVFYDGPAPTRLRYCMNSAAMKFIAKKDMVKEGYGEYLWLVN